MIHEVEELKNRRVQRLYHVDRGDASGRIHRWRAVNPSCTLQSGTTLVGEGCNG